MIYIAKVAAFFNLAVIAVCYPIAELISSQPDVSPMETIEAISGSESNNPSLRVKRDVDCPFPLYWRELVQELNISSIIELPQEPAISVPPANQTPSEGWPGTADHSKSTCPWKYEEVDLGDSYYPRYIFEAVCLCETCILSNSLNCKKFRTNITVFRRVECRDGFAVMTAVNKRVTSGCFCAGAGATTPKPATPTE